MSKRAHTNAAASHSPVKRICVSQPPWPHETKQGDRMTPFGLLSNTRTVLAAMLLASTSLAFDLCELVVKYHDGEWKLPPLQCIHWIVYPRIRLAQLAAQLTQKFGHSLSPLVSAAWDCEVGDFWGLDIQAAVHLQPCSTPPGRWVAYGCRGWRNRDWQWVSESVICCRFSEDHRDSCTPAKAGSFPGYLVVIDTEWDEDAEPRDTVAVDVFWTGHFELGRAPLCPCDPRRTGDHGSIEVRAALTCTSSERQRVFGTLVSHLTAGKTCSGTR
jgi:hypothetical protein